MEIHLTYYGQLKDVTGKASETMPLETPTVNGLKRQLEARYPDMEALTYVLAENDAVLGERDPISSGRIDVFPPFSGG